MSVTKNYYSIDSIVGTNVYTYIFLSIESIQHYQKNVYYHNRSFQILPHNDIIFGRFLKSFENYMNYKTFIKIITRYQYAIYQLLSSERYVFINKTMEEKISYI